MSASDPTPTHPFGFNVIGFVSGDFGLAVAARNTVRMLAERGYGVRVVDIDAGGGRSGHSPEFAHLESQGRADAPYAVNLFHMNPPDAANVLRDRPRLLGLGDRLNVCVPFWELPRLPAKDWVPFLEAMDLVLCPTRFILDAVRASAPRARGEHYAQTVYMPQGVEADRPAFGLPADATLFLASFDSGSDVERKNPFAAVEAFERAFGDRDDVRLVIKINSGRAGGRHRDVLSWGVRRLEEVLGPKKNAIVIDQSLAYRDVLRLYASCDVMVSLHRSEGLGLHLIEAMALAKPVIATRWSGNMDFMDEQDSMLMDYRMVPVASRHPIYAPESIGEGQTWADPDIAQAADAMTLLADQPDLRRAIGERARADYMRDHEAFRDSAMPETLRELWIDRTSRLPDHDQRSTDLARLRRMGLYRGLRRRAGRALRAMGLRL